MRATSIAFFNATRPRTYPLAIAGVLVGNALAFSKIGNFNSHNWLIFALTLWVALGLQILSNLANDYGDGIKGTDNHRLDRQIAQRRLSPTILKYMIFTWSGIVFISGVILCWVAFNTHLERLSFIGLGIVAIIAAITYTMGKCPYGYHAKGEIAVFTFFGLLNVLGSVYLQTQFIRISDLLAASTVGLLCTCVLMINNMRDIDTDKLTGKHTLAVAMGKENISQLYRFLLLTAYFLLMTFDVLRQNFYMPLVLLMSYHVFRHLKAVSLYADNIITPTELGPELKQIVFITLGTSILMTIGVILFNWR